MVHGKYFWIFLQSGKRKLISHAIDCYFPPIPIALTGRLRIHLPIIGTVVRVIKILAGSVNFVIMKAIASVPTVINKN